MNKKQFKGTNIYVTENLSSLQMAKLKDVRDEYGFNKVWNSDSTIMVMEKVPAKPKVIKEHMDDSWINYFVAYRAMKKEIFGRHCFTYFGVITLGHVRVFKYINFTMLFLYFLRSFNKWEYAFQKSCLIISLTFFLNHWKNYPCVSLIFLSY